MYKNLCPAAIRKPYSGGKSRSVEEAESSEAP